MTTTIINELIAVRDLMAPRILGTNGDAAELMMRINSVINMHKDKQPSTNEIRIEELERKVGEQAQLIGSLQQALGTDADGPELIAHAAVIHALATDRPEETPASRWRVNGQADPHGTRYDCERRRTAMGHMTDDELANAIYLDPNIGNLTAAKDRIRWLSRLVHHLAVNECLQKVRPGEPTFTLLGRDKDAVPAILAWIEARTVSEGWSDKTKRAQADAGAFRAYQAAGAIALSGAPPAGPGTGAPKKASGRPD